jgi:hypothetical protein
VVVLPCEKMPEPYATECAAFEHLTPRQAERIAYRKCGPDGTVDWDDNPRFPPPHCNRNGWMGSGIGQLERRVSRNDCGRLRHWVVPVSTRHEHTTNLLLCIKELREWCGNHDSRHAKRGRASDRRGGMTLYDWLAETVAVPRGAYLLVLLMVAILFSLFASSRR